jgi:hypothetical protein
MLRIMSFVAAVAAIVVIPFTQADARQGGTRMSMGSSHSMGARSFGPGVRSVGTVRSFNTVHSVKHAGPGRIIVANHRFRHHRRYPFFVGVGAYGLYDSCWRWVPTVYGYRRLWVCDPYPYY